MTDPCILNADLLRAALVHTCDCIAREREQLCALDAAAGDGDLGVTLATGFGAVRRVLIETPSDDLGQLVQRAGMELGRAAPSTMGTLLATALLRAGAQVRGRAAVSSTDLAAMLEAAANGVRERGGAEVGQRTVLDAMVPAAAAAAAAAREGLSPVDVLGQAVAAAHNGAAATIEMEPQVGRASWIAERARGHQDAGATAWAILLEGMLQGVRSNAAITH